MLVGYFVSNSYIKTQYELLNILINYGVDKRAIYYDITNNYVVNKKRSKSMFTQKHQNEISQKYQTKYRKNTKRNA